MKKALIASTALVLSAGIAAADVTISGSGRFGLVYFDPDVPGTDGESQIENRLRFNIDASKETDAGVKFGGRIRLQYEQGDTIEGGEGAAELNAAMLYAEASGFRVEVGNVNTAFDSMSTLYNAELGYIGSTFGGYAQASYTSYRSNPYSPAQSNRVGIFASYSVGDLVARVSYVTPDQTPNVDTEDEISVSFDYATGPFKVGLGFAKSGNFVEDNDIFALTGEYALNDTTNIGLQLVDNGDIADSSTITIYGNKAFGPLSVGAYLASNDDDANEDDIAVGIGAGYDLGGATVAGTIQQGYNGETYADVGVTFSF